MKPPSNKNNILMQSSKWQMILALNLCRHRCHWCWQSYDHLTNRLCLPGKSIVHWEPAGPWTTPEYQIADGLVASATNSVSCSICEPEVRVCVLISSFLSFACDVIAASDPGFWERDFLTCFTFRCCPQHAPSRPSHFSHQLYFYRKWFRSSPCVQPLSRILVRKHLKYA